MSMRKARSMNTKTSHRMTFVRMEHTTKKNDTIAMHIWKNAVRELLA